MTELEQGSAGGERRRRSGGRPTGERSRLPQQRPWAQPRMRYRPTEVVSADELESIHVASLRVLVRDRDGLPRPRRARGPAGRPGRAWHARHATRPVRPGDGHRADQDGARRSSPSTPVTPAHDVQLGGDWVAFGTVGSPPNVADLDRGRRIGNRVDYQNLLRLGQLLNSVHFLSGYPVEPVDIHASRPPPRRHVRRADPDGQGDPLPTASAASATSTCLEMVRIARGVDAATIDARAVDLHGRQLELAAPARHADAPGHHGVRGPQPGRVHDPVHAGRRDGAGHPGRRPGRAERRGAGRDGPDPGRPPGCTGRSTAGSPRTSTCSRARRPSARRSTCGRR